MRPARMLMGLLMVSALSATALAGGSPSGKRSERRSRGAKQRASKLIRGYRGAHGYYAPVPLSSQTDGQRTAWKETMPMDSFGAVVTEHAPKRASATYLGQHNGKHLVAIAEHVGNKNPLSVEFGQASGEKFSAKVTGKLFASVAGDSTIVEVKAEGANAAKLDALKGIKLSGTDSLQALKAKKPKAKFYVVGRGKFDWVKGDIQRNPKVYGKRAARRWLDKAVEAEAAANGGDVQVVMPAELVAGGLVMPLRDPDGLTVEGADSDGPFLPVRSNWIVDSAAMANRVVGRLSGGALVMVEGKGKRAKVTQVGLPWTLGVPENLKAIKKQVKKDPMRAFGRVVEVRGEGDNADRTTLKLEQTAPFGYASSVESLVRGLVAHRNSGDISSVDRQTIDALIKASR